MQEFWSDSGAWNYQLRYMYEDTLLLGKENSGQGLTPNCGW